MRHSEAWIAVVVEGDTIKTKLFPSAAARGLYSGRVNVSLMSNPRLDCPCSVKPGRPTCG